MQIIPQVIWLGDTANRRYELIPTIHNTTMVAAAIAIHLKQADLALEWLEQGRLIVWNQLLQLRTPLDELAITNSALANRLKQVAHDLENASLWTPNSSHVAPNPAYHEEVAQRHRRLAEDWQKLIEQARLIPGFHDFLRPMRKRQLVSAAWTTSVVIIAVHKDNCGALVIRAGETDVTSMELTAFTFDKAAEARTNLMRSLQKQGRDTRGFTNQPKETSSTELILKMLWDDVAKPILNLLGLIETPVMGQLPHITWCLTGPLAFLPLHAAGDYTKPGCTLFDYAISSYTPNLASLLASPADPAGFSGIVAVGQTSTPGLTPLPGTRAELDFISSKAGDTTSFTRLEGDSATTSAVLGAMEQYSWVHLACHASQNRLAPTASAFHLHDGPLDLATITRKQLKHADLAFLSACQTATGDDELPEEAVHLAAGMIMAGYRRVIATMWSIDDRDAPLVADRFYAYMLNDQMPSENKAAKALHHAIDCLRKDIGTNEFGRWAPYIHIGL
ncbi:hypothetical protein FRC07_000129 [Ceratobasidium sp. 392]|nr:hypothetical protein FRC07_000129 [Ceratobasidium sp. 392]